jgi:amidase
MAGTPHITIPLGEAYGLPIGLSIMGKAWSDHEMIQLAYTLEHLLK